MNPAPSKNSTYLKEGSWVIENMSKKEGAG